MQKIRKRHPWRLMIGLLIAFSLVAAACSSDDSGSDTTVAAATETTVAAATETTVAAATETTVAAATETTVAAGDGATGSASLADMSWDEVVAQAQEEGEVVWFQWYFQPEFREFVESFEDEFGIDVRVPDGGLDVNVSKLLAESGRETGDIDVLSASGGSVSALDLEELFMPIDQIANYGILPTTAEGLESAPFGVAFWGNQTGFAYEPSRVDVDGLPQTWDELTAWIQANPGQFAFNDPTAGGAGQSMINSAIREITGFDDYFDAEVDPAKIERWEPVWEWFETYEDSYGVTGGNADSLVRLNDGEFSVVVAWEDQLASFHREGTVSTDVAFYIPDFGMNGGVNLVMVPANAPNPAAALVFIDWLTSAETQAELNAVFGSSPTNPEADDSNSLVPAAQRENQREWASQPYKDEFVQTFVDRIING